jgi:hypothetical protein
MSVLVQMPSLSESSTHVVGAVVPIVAVEMPGCVKKGLAYEKSLTGVPAAKYVSG